MDQQEEQQKRGKQEVRVEQKAAARKTVRHGSIRTTIFANHDGFGGFAYRIVQKREYVHDGERGFSPSLRPKDLLDAIRGLLTVYRYLRQRQIERWDPFAEF